LERSGGFSTIAFCEIEEFPRKVLAKHWPNVPIHHDIRKLTAGDLPDDIGLICGGVPCQPASVAGKRAGADDDRWLWPEALRIVSEILPKWVIFENVYGFISLNESLEFDKVLSQMEAIGYEVQSFVIPACAVDAPHRRDRVWIIAHAELKRGRADAGAQPRTETKPEELQQENGPALPDNAKAACGAVANTRLNPGCGRRERQGPEISGFSSRWEPEPGVGQLVDGLSRKMDGCLIWTPESVPRVATGVPNRANRLKGLGNAVVPALVTVIGRAIMEIESR